MHRYGVTPCFSATACSARRVRLHVLLRAAAETAAEPQRVRRALGPQIAQGVPFGQYMHELHALPALLPLAQACGALSMTRVAAHTPGPWGVIAMAVSFGLAWTVVMEINRAATGAFPYTFLLQLSLPQRGFFYSSCYVAVGLLALLMRALVMRLGSAPGTAAARKRR